MVNRNCPAYDDCAEAHTLGCDRCRINHRVIDEIDEMSKLPIGKEMRGKIDRWTSKRHDCEFGMIVNLKDEDWHKLQYLRNVLGVDSSEVCVRALREYFENIEKEIIV